MRGWRGGRGGHDGVGGGEVRVGEGAVERRGGRRGGSGGRGVGVGVRVLLGVGGQARSTGWPCTTRVRARIPPGLPDTPKSFNISEHVNRFLNLRIHVFSLLEK